MMQFQLRALAPRLVQRLRMRAGPRWQEAIHNALTEIAAYAEARLKLRIAEKKAVFTGQLMRDISVGVSTRAGAMTAWVWLEAPYARVVDIGRRPGKPPPYRALVKWVRRRLRIRKRAVGVAIAIAKSIGKRGIAGRHFMRAAVRDVERAVPEVMKRHVAKWRRDMGGGA